MVTVALFPVMLGGSSLKVTEPAAAPRPLASRVSLRAGALAAVASWYLTMASGPSAPGVGSSRLIEKTTLPDGPETSVCTAGSCPGLYSVRFHRAGSMPLVPTATSPTVSCNCKVKAIVLPKRAFLEVCVVVTTVDVAKRASAPSATSKL